MVGVEVVCSWCGASTPLANTCLRVESLQAFLASCKKAKQRQHQSNQRNITYTQFMVVRLRRALSVVANPLRAPLRGLTCTSQILLLSDCQSVNTSLFTLWVVVCQH